MDPTELTPKQQTSEAIRQSETILILTGQHPSVDQAAAATALAMVLRRYGKKVTAIISDNLPPQAGFLPGNELDRSLNGLRDFILKIDQSKAQAEKLRYVTEDGKLNIYITPQKGGFNPSDVTFAHGKYHYDLAIVLGVPTRARIDKVFQDNSGLFAQLPLVNFDFHRSNEQYGAINLIEPTASSLCEMLVALAESLQSGLIDETVATCLLGGIMAATDRFTAAHTTAKSLTVAAQMLAAGAKQQTVVKSLYRDKDRSGERGDNKSRERREETQSGSSAAAQPVAAVTAEAPQPPVADIPMAAAQAAQAEADENLPIIEPMHIEPEPEAETMADFAEAVQVLKDKASANEPAEPEAA